MKLKKLISAVAGISVTVAAGAGLTTASSHREAPKIAEDQYADNTDVYTFISPSDPNRLVMVANYVPLLIPHSGPNFYKFAENTFYEIHVDNNGDAKDDITYRWEFTNKIKNGNTFLYNTGPVDSLTSPNLNVTQSYTLTRIDHANGNKKKTLFSNAPVAPWHVGKNSFPNYEAVALQAVQNKNGYSAFAGPRDEPFFVDLHVFDLLGVGAGFESTNGVNVMSLVLEVPITDVARGGVRPPASETGPTAVVGIHATASRPQIRILRKGRTEDEFGSMIQVSRLAWPLVNEVIIPLKDKDKYNRSLPKDDVRNFGAYVLDPEIPKLLSAVLRLNCRVPGPEGRTDLVALLGPNNTTVADLLRINITANQNFAATAFPNGRKLTDDVTDALLTEACKNGSPVSDQVDANDLPFSGVMPYLASPASGNP